MADRLVRRGSVLHKGLRRFPQRCSRWVAICWHHAWSCELLRVPQHGRSGEGFLLGRCGLWRIFRLGCVGRLAHVLVRGTALFHQGFVCAAQRCDRHGSASWLCDIRRLVVRNPGLVRYGSCCYRVWGHAVRASAMGCGGQMVFRHPTKARRVLCRRLRWS